MDPITRSRDGAGAAAASPRSNRKALTIGAVAKILSREFEDVSISKIRYLEDQKLLSPQRTPGGYRLYSQGDVERLRSILRMQRDEFLPLRVIRQELSSGGGNQPGKRTATRAAISVENGAGQIFELSDLVEETGLSQAMAAELVNHKILQPQTRDGVETYDDADREIAKACVELARFGVEARNLRVFRTSADREAVLIHQLVAPGLSSSNQARRRESLEDVESLAAVCGNLKQLLLMRDLRSLTGE